MNDRARRLLRESGVDGVLLTDPASMRYICGFTGEGYCFVTRDTGMVVTDSRYTIAAKAECEDMAEGEGSRCLVKEWNSSGYYRPLIQAVRDDAVRSVGYEDEHLTVSAWDSFRKKIERNARIKPLKGKAEELRQIKTEEEIGRIREAEAIGDRAFVRLMLDFGVDSEKLGVTGKDVAVYHERTPMIPKNTTERQVAARLEYYLKDEGGSALSFETIAASGENGAKPHAVPSDKRLREGELLTLDFGCIYEGYCSDMTRTVSIGQPSSECARIYDIVRRAQEAALAAIRPGMTGQEADAVARDIIREEGYGNHFGHSLGHSVGLKIHERPGFTPKEKTVIQPGMVISVEPGIYVEHVGGVRIEDLIVVRENGHENLAHSVKEMIII